MYCTVHYISYYTQIVQYTARRFPFPLPLFPLSPGVLHVTFKRGVVRGNGLQVDKINDGIDEKSYHMYSYIGLSNF